MIQTNSIGIEFVGNYPDVRKPATAEQTAAWLVLVRFLQERYGIPSERVYAHNWIDYKDTRYCEGCELADKARALRYVPGGDKPVPAAATAAPPEPDKDYLECAARLAPLAVFTPLPAVTEPAECAVGGLVRLEAVLMRDRSRVALQPPATLRCAMAEAVVQFVRSEVGPAAAALGSPLAAITTANSYDCRGRNRQPGAKLSEHGHANALDIAALRLADRSTVSLTSQTVSQEFRGRDARRRLPPLHDRARPGLRRLSQRPHPSRSRRAQPRLPDLPVGRAAAAAAASPEAAAFRCRGRSRWR